MATVARTLSRPLILIGFVIISLSLYFNSLGNSFIFDDNFLIVDNPYVKNFDVPGIFTTGIFHFKPQDSGPATHYYRPFQALGYSLEYRIWKADPAGYRISNIILHSLNSFLVFLIIFLLLENEIAALLCAIFFCIHPAHVSLVAFIAGRSNLLETFFMMSGVLAYVYWIKNRSNQLYYFSILFYICALLTREGALLMPLYIALCAIILKAGKRKTALSLIAYFVIGLVYLLTRRVFLPSDALGAGISNLPGLFAAFVLRLQDYFWQLLLSLDIKEALFNQAGVRALAYICSSALIVYACIRTVFHRNPAVMLGSALYILGFLPLIKLHETVNYFGPVLSEHYAYNASIGFCLILAYAVLALREHFSKLSAALFIAICLVFPLSTIRATFHYKNEKSFYKYVLSIDENNAIARLNLGNVYYQERNYALAADEALWVIRHEPSAWDGYFLLGNVFEGQRDFAKAADAYRTALSLNPRSERVLNNLGILYDKSGEHDKAIESFEKAFALNPESPVVLANMAGSLIKNGEYDKALNASQKLLALNGGDAGTFTVVGIAFAEAGYLREAEVFLKEALRISPEYFDAMKNLGALYGNTGNIDSAVRIFKRALKVRPDDKETELFLEKAQSLKK